MKTNKILELTTEFFRDKFYKDNVKQVAAYRGEARPLKQPITKQEVEKTLSADNPDVFFQVLREIGALAVILPELDALFNLAVENNDTNKDDSTSIGQQALTQLKQSASLSTDLAVRFAALMQQLDNNQISIKALAKRCKVPNEHRDLALQVSAQQENIHNARSLTPVDIIRLFDNTDAWRKPARFQQILLTCASSQVSKLVDDYQPTQYLTTMLNAACDIAVQPIIAAGFRGAEIKQQLTTQRITALTLLRPQ